MSNSVRLGNNAGTINQGSQDVAIGNYSGNSNQVTLDKIIKYIT